MDQNLSKTLHNSQKELFSAGEKRVLGEQFLFEGNTTHAIKTGWLDHMLHIIMIWQKLFL